MTIHGVRFITPAAPPPPWRPRPKVKRLPRKLKKRLWVAHRYRLNASGN